MKLRGEITVFLSLSMLCVFALLCVMVESARTAGSRYYFQMAVNGSLDVLFSKYNKKLWQQYRILGLWGEADSFTKEMEQDVAAYLDVENWYPLRLESLECTGYHTLTEKGGDYFAEEAEKYMEYGLWANFTVGPEDGEAFLSDIKEAAAAGEAAVDCDGQERLVQKVEEAVARFLDCVKEQEQAAKDIGEALDRDEPGRFRSAARRFFREEERMEGLFQDYERQARTLKEKIMESDVAWGEMDEDLSGDNRNLLEEQRTVFSVYAQEDENRREELLKQWEKGRKNAALLETVTELVEDLEEEYEDELEDYERDPENESRPSLSLEPAAGRWRGYAFTTLSYEREEGDPEKRRFLEQVRSLIQGDLLELVLPEGSRASEARLPLEESPSKTETQPSEEGFSLVRQILLGEYGAIHFLSYGSEEKGAVQYELEYILQGADKDRENLEKTVSQLFLMRQGVNFLQILRDGEMRREATALAAVITGAVGLAPLTEVCACFVMGVWAMGEAVMDLRVLMAGGAIPLWKRSGEWKLSLEGLLKMGETKIPPGAGLEYEENEKRPGTMDYQAYLKLLLLMEDVRDKQMRMLDVIQMNIRRKEEGFLLRQCVCQVDIRGNACGKHLFFTLPFVEKLTSGAEGYLLTAESSQSY